MAVAATRHWDLGARLFDGTGEADGYLEDIKGAPSCAHHLAPAASLLMKLKVVPTVYAVASRLIEMDRRFLLPKEAVFREQIYTGASHITLDAATSLFATLEAFIRADDSKLSAVERVTRDRTIETLGFSEITPGVLIPSMHYCRMFDPATRAGPRIIPFPTLVTNCGFRDVSAFAQSGAFQDHGELARMILHHLQDGYLARNGNMRGAYKVTRRTALFLYDGLRRAYEATGRDLVPFSMVFSTSTRSGPRNGQCTRSLPISEGNLVSPLTPEALAA